MMSGTLFKKCSTLKLCKGEQIEDAKRNSENKEKRKLQDKTG